MGRQDASNFLLFMIVKNIIRLENTKEFVSEITEIGKLIIMFNKAKVIIQKDKFFFKSCVKHSDNQLPLRWIKSIITIWIKMIFMR